MNCKIQTGLRIPEERYETLLNMSEDMGVSLNSLVLMLVDVGLSAISLGTQAKGRDLLHNPPDSVE